MLLIKYLTLARNSIEYFTYKISFHLHDKPIGIIMYYYLHFVGKDIA